MVEFLADLKNEANEICLGKRRR